MLTDYEYGIDYEIFVDFLDGGIFVPEKNRGKNSGQIFTTSSATVT